MTTAAEPRASAKPRLPRDRMFFTTMAIIVLISTIAGFAPSYYLRGTLPPAHPYEPLNLLVHLHGLVFSLWILLFAVQAGLVASGKVAVHRRLGVAGVVLITLMIPLAILVALHGVHRPLTAPPGIPPLSWLAVPLLDIPVFCGLIVAALAFRRTPATHKRLMMLAMFDMLQPSLGRMTLPIDQPFKGLLPLLFVVALVLWDLYTLKRVHPATLIGGLVAAVVMIATPMVWMTPGWLAFAGWAAGLVG
ncbi:hypothetical protein [Brevundimonas sp.]|uniref:hypothetical protein n=1 Tax=Brevundimonas sp. TaxID=1871086 RepID=UPI001A22E473|nr:hypothetical protein [Brevundimonas sp.]MBJ7485169.1 hypothetical protein [Brevundimonas sp.]